MASVGSPIQSLADFIKTTGFTVLTNKTHITNAARRQTHLLKFILPGVRVSGGESIRDDVYLAIDSSAQHVGVNPELDYRMRDVLQQWTSPWRFTVDHHTLSEQAVDLNISGKGPDARHHQYKRYRDGMDINLTTSLVTLMDDDLLAQPDNSEMEASGGFTPYPLNVFIHEGGDRAGTNTFTALGTGTTVAGYAGNITAALDVNGTAWTTIQGISGATEPGWRNPVVNYTTFGDHRAGADLFNAFQMLYDLLHFDALPWRPEHGEMTMQKGIFTASLIGRRNYTNSLISSGDTLQHTNDPGIKGPNFMGIPVAYIRKKDTATIYPTGGSGAASTEGDTTGTTNAGPRYEAFNLNDPMYGLGKVVHPGHMFRVKDPFFPSHQPYNLVTCVDTYENQFCQSRLQAGGVIAPATADITGVYMT